MEEEAASDFFKTALFIVAAGSNDILEYLSPSVPFFGREKPYPSYFLDVLVSNLTFYQKVLPIYPDCSFCVACSCLLLTSIFFPSIKRLNELGARKFVVSCVNDHRIDGYV